MEMMNCPHCGAGNAIGAAFCASCGKALPSANPTGPRFVSSDATAITSAGLKLQTDELAKNAKKASGALLAVAIIQTVVGGILLAVFSSVPASSRTVINLPLFFGPVLGVGVIFWGLYFWSRRNPLPAAIVGLVVYVSIWVLDILGAIMMMANAPSGGGTSGNTGPNFSPISSGIVIRIIIIAILVRAIRAGAQHRKLLRQQAAASGVPMTV
jgi:hypothetical protein